MKYAQLVIGPAGSGKARVGGNGTSFLFPPVRPLRSEQRATRSEIATIAPAHRTQSTFCHQIHEHCASVGRTVHIANLDPAADRFDYPVSIDIKGLIDVEVPRGPSAPLPPWFRPGAGRRRKSPSRA